MWVITCADIDIAKDKVEARTMIILSQLCMHAGCNYDHIFLLQRKWGLCTALVAVIHLKFGPQECKKRGHG